MKKSQPQEASQESRGRAVGPEEAAPPQRWSARLKAEVAIRLIRGESLDALSRETRQPAARLTEWREEFLAGGAEALKSRRDDPVEEAHAEERRRLQAKIGELAMDNELLYERCHKLEAGLPPGRRKSKR
tara:strand:- start:990 stop:1379 length:390 start_codon:yes stop_codon:yes gene_type:complete